MQSECPGHRKETTKMGAEHSEGTLVRVQGVYGSAMNKLLSTHWRKLP